MTEEDYKAHRLAITAIAAQVAGEFNDAADLRRSLSVLAIKLDKTGEDVTPDILRDFAAMSADERKQLARDLDSGARNVKLDYKTIVAGFPKNNQIRRPPSTALSSYEEKLFGLIDEDDVTKLTHAYKAIQPLGRDTVKVLFQAKMKAITEGRLNCAKFLIEKDSYQSMEEYKIFCFEAVSQDNYEMLELLAANPVISRQDNFKALDYCYHAARQGCTGVIHWIGNKIINPDPSSSLNVSRTSNGYIVPQHYRTLDRRQWFFQMLCGALDGKRFDIAKTIIEEFPLYKDKKAIIDSKEISFLAGMAIKKSRTDILDFFEDLGMDVRQKGLAGYCTSLGTAKYLYDKKWPISDEDYEHIIKRDDVEILVFFLKHLPVENLEALCSRATRINKSPNCLLYLRWYMKKEAPDHSSNAAEFFSIIENIDLWNKKLQMSLPKGLEKCSPLGLRPSVLQFAHKIIAGEMGGIDHFKNFAEVEAEAHNNNLHYSNYVLATLGMPYYFEDRGKRKKVQPDYFERTEEAVNTYAYGLTRLFRDEERILRYLKQWGCAGKQPLHDLAWRISIPEGGNPDWKAWGDAVLQCGPAMANLVKFADKLSKPLTQTIILPNRTERITVSLVLTRNEIARNAYARGKEHQELAAICFEFVETEKTFNTALDIWLSQKAKGFPAKNIPDFDIAGEAFGFPGARFIKLADHDPRALFLGEYSDCCQSIGHAGRSCTEHGFTSDQSGFYMVLSPEDEIIGQTWAWRGKRGELVFDSLETLGNRVLAEQWKSILDECRKSLNGHNPCRITELLVGKGGDTPDLGAKTDTPATPVDYNGYRDSDAQYCIWRSTALKPCIQPCP